MKKIILLFVIFHSCSSYVKTNPSKSSVSYLTELEKEIINDFLDEELKKERYKNYKYLDKFVFDQSIKQIKSVEAYIYSFNEWQVMNKYHQVKDTSNLYFLNRLQIDELKSKTEDQQSYSWKENDFNNFRVKLISYKSFNTKSISKKVFFEKKSFVISISKPLIIDQKNALISFEFSNCEYVCNNINHLTVLMRKIDSHWVQVGYYEDGVFY